jgi:hypothetical protein
MAIAIDNLWVMGPSISTTMSDFTSGKPSGTHAPG